MRRIETRSTPELQRAFYRVVQVSAIIERLGEKRGLPMRVITKNTSKHVA